jgi:GTP:adenosylcobinamide-phosphate guanylyltransferase
MDAIVIAGGIPNPEDPLYEFLKGDAKALVDVAGKPMIQWVLDALGNAKLVDNVVLVGLSYKTELACKKPLYYVSNQGRMLANIVAGVNKSLELNKKTQHVLIVSSDIPALKAEHVDWLVETSMQTNDDLYYGVCPRDVMEARFPNSKRTYTHLKDMDVCGADMNVTHVRMATEHLDMWETLIGSRKSPLRQAGIIGFGTLFALLTRRLTLEDALSRVCDRIGIKGRAIVWQHAEPCMDVDKPHQLELLRNDLAEQQRKSIAREKAAARRARAAAAKPATPANKRADGSKKPAASKDVKSRSRLKTPAKLTTPSKVKIK